MERHTDVMLEALRAGGVKLTPQRRAIVALFAGDPTHPTAQEIFDRLTVEHPGISFATVYNTLAKLRSLGLCREIAVQTGATRFDPNVGRHHHTVCDRCGAVRDVPAHELARPSIPGFAVRAVEHIYRGVCTHCSSGTVRRKTSHSDSAPAPRARAGSNRQRSNTQE